jgi:hypothetical protein
MIAATSEAPTDTRLASRSSAEIGKAISLPLETDWSPNVHHYRGMVLPSLGFFLGL